MYYWEDPVSKCSDPKDKKSNISFKPNPMVTIHTFRTTDQSPSMGNFAGDPLELSFGLVTLSGVNSSNLISPCLWTLESHRHSVVVNF